jgi:peptidyl-prolyl cis-trans isomerase D
MQIIQSIREKGAAIVIAVIALSLIGFILMDAKQGSNQLFSSQSNNVGEINGQSISLAEFNKKVKTAEDNQAQQSGQRPSGAQTYQIREQVWNQMVAENVFFSEAKKLGIEFTPKELSTILLSNDPSNPLLQEPSLKDSITGKLDFNKAKDALNNIKKLKGEQKDAINSQMIEPLKLNTTAAKYTALLNSSAYYPTWMQKKDAAEAKSFAIISYVTVPYGEISDSLVKVTDQDINDYVSKHKEQFKQEKGRNVSYVDFSLLPSLDDSTVAYNAVNELKSQFQADTNNASFFARNASSVDFKDDFVTKEKMTNQIFADTLASLAPGAVFGPYVQRENYVLAKKISSKQLPDSVKARHILIATTNQQTGAEIMSDTLAKKLADSIYNAIQSGADFAMMALKYSADGSKDKGGDLGTFGYGAMVSEFNDYCFTKPAGSKGVVKTQFGYHIIDVVSQKDFKTAYKIAYFGKEIVASDVTVNKASSEATKASGVKSKAELEKYISKAGLSLTTVPDLIKENDYKVGRLGDARALVRWIFEAKKGDISEPFSIGDQFVVAVLDKVKEEGVQDAETARVGCEAIIRNQKKADMIKKKIGNNPTLESASAAYGKTIQVAGNDSTVLLNAQFINGVGMEPKVIGASFNKAYQSKVSPLIDGTTGVFIIKVNTVQNKPDESPEVLAQQYNTKISSIKSQTNGWYEALKKRATIVDERSKRF